jgi:hypothetical protein
MPAWREWLLGNRGRQDRRATAVVRAVDMWERAGKASAAVLPIMAKVEKLALQVYGDHGLPIQPGHYRRGPGSTDWVFLGEYVDAEIRWAMILENPPEAGWRYATLEDLGRAPGGPAELQAASNLLATCRHLKSRLLGREPGEVGDDIETAIRLGVDWRELQDLISWREASRLKLTTPSDVLPPPEPKKAAKPARKPRTTRKKKAD